MHVHRLSCTQSPLYLHSAMSVCMPPENAIYTLPCLCACHLQCLKPHSGMLKVYAHAHATHSVSITAPVCSTSFIWAKLHSTAVIETLWVACACALTFMHTISTLSTLCHVCVHATCKCNLHSAMSMCMPPAMSQTTFWHVKVYAH